MLLGECSTRITSEGMSMGSALAAGMLSFIRSGNTALLKGVMGKDFKESPRLNWVCVNFGGIGGNLASMKDVWLFTEIG